MQSKWLIGVAATVALAMGASTTAHARDLTCHISFNLSGWSAFYKTAKGTGVVTCDNGQSMSVHLRTKGGGLTFGKIHITDGRGRFTGLNNINEVLGHYATAEAHAGTSDKSSKAQVMTKGNVSLALTGKGHGWNLGVDFGAFIIER